VAKEPYGLHHLNSRRSHTAEVDEAAAAFRSLIELAIARGAGIT